MADPKNGLMKMDTNDLSILLGEEVTDLTQRPDFIPEGDKTGTEGITAEDIRIPRIQIAQAMSPQMVDPTAKIPNLELSQMFNDFTKEIYGNGPILFVAVRRDVRIIEFRPLNEGGGVLEMDLERDDPRTKWTKDGDGKKVPPKATTFHEFTSLLIKKSDTTGEHQFEPVVISIKQTNKFNRRATQDLNGFIKMHGSQGLKSVPIYGVIYAISTHPEKNDKGWFGVPTVKQVGFIPPKLHDLYLRAQEYAASLQGKTISVEGLVDDGTSFDVVDGEVR